MLLSSFLMLGQETGHRDVSIGWILTIIGFRGGAGTVVGPFPRSTE